MTAQKKILMGWLEFVGGNSNRHILHLFERTHTHLHMITYTNA